jgi:putative DNA primase/helicase
MPHTLTALEIAGRLGLKRHRLSWRGRCPACDYATTFSVRAGRDGRALLFCASCRDRDAVAEAVAHAFSSLCRGEKTGQAALPPGWDEAAQRQRKQDRALALWCGSEPAPGTPAERYLTARGLPGLVASPALRFRADTPHPEDGRCPAMIALVSAPDGAPLAVHRTYITREGRKASVDPPKASLGPVWGGAIALQARDLGRALVIAEGIETAASAGLLMGLPAWAALSAGNMAKGLVLPPDARHVVIAADPDDAGRTAARDAWTRWTAEGRAVRIAVPDDGGDFNDLLMARGPNHAA